MNQGPPCASSYGLLPTQGVCKRDKAQQRGKEKGVTFWNLLSFKHLDGLLLLNTVTMVGHAGHKRAPPLPFMPFSPVVLPPPPPCLSPSLPPLLAFFLFFTFSLQRFSCLCVWVCTERHRHDASRRKKVKDSELGGEER